MNSSENKSLAVYQMLTAGLAGVLLGGLGGFLIGNSSSADVTASSPTTVTDTATAPETDTAGGWSEQGSQFVLPEADLDAPLPQDVYRDTPDNYSVSFGWQYNTPVADKPDVVVWEDFQCPACAAFERSPAIPALLEGADKGDYNLIFRPLAFLDAGLKNDSSERSTAAWGCAIDAGVGEKYRALVFANQPTEEGVGYTDADLLFGGQLAGLEGDNLTAFETCVQNDTYRSWAPTSSVQTPQTITGTPNITVNGEVVENIWEFANVQAAVDAATK